MARAPFLVFIYPYRKTEDNGFEYALLKSAERGFWEGAAGGGEDNETLLEAAGRETFEEAGLPADSAFIKLDTTAPVPAARFKESALWGSHIYVIPLHYFGVLVNKTQIKLIDFMYQFMKSF